MTPFDCERLRDGLLAQPINSLSALAFVAAAMVLWRRGRPVAALSAGATGVGSVWFHANPTGAAEWAHDISLYALVAVAAVELGRRIAARRLPVPALALFTVGLAFWAMGRSGGAFCEPEAVLQWHALWHATAAAAVVILFAPTPAPAARTA